MTARCSVERARRPTAGLAAVRPDLRWNRRSRPLEACLSAVEPLREALGGGALHTPDPGHRPKEVGGEPRLRRLGREMSYQQIELALEARRCKGGEEVRRPEVAVVFRDLVFEDEMIAPRVPRQVGDEPVILMAVTPIVGEDQIGIELALQRFELVLHRRTGVRQETVPVISNDHLARGYASEESTGRTPRLGPTPGRRREDDPQHPEPAALGDQPPDRSPPAHLESARVGPRR